MITCLGPFITLDSRQLTADRLSTEMKSVFTVVMASIENLN